MTTGTVYLLHFDVFLSIRMRLSDTFGESVGRHRSATEQGDSDGPSGRSVDFTKSVGEPILEYQKQSATNVDTGVKFLRITDISEGGVLWSSVPFAEIPEAKVESFLLHPGDIVFARTGATTGKSYIIGDCPKAIFASYLIRLRILTGADPHFICHYFNTSSYWVQISQTKAGAAQPGVNSTKLQDLLIPLPPLPEQRRIAAQEDVVAAARAFKRSLMQRLLVDELVDCERRSLVDCANVWTGGTPDTKSPEYWSNGSVEWVTAEDVSSAPGPFIRTTSRRITQAGLSASPAKMLPPLTTIVIARGATMGKVAVIPHSMAMNQTCYGFEAKSGVNPLYLYYALSLLRQEMLSISYGTIFTTITRGILNLITFPVPDEKSQGTAVDILLAIDAKIAAEEDRKTALEALFTSMLHQLMTGQLRLLVDERLPM